MAKNRFLTTNYGYNNSSNRYAFKINTVTVSANTTVNSIIIETGDKTQEFLDTINSYVPNTTTGQEAVFYNCNIRTKNSLYSEPRLLEIKKEAENKLSIVFWTMVENKGNYTFSLSPLVHPSESMVKTNETDNLDSGKIHNVFFLDEYPLLGNIEIGYYSVNVGYGNIGGQVSTFSNGQFNIPLGDFSSTFGWKNKTGYACSAFGFENKILGQESSGFGAKITIANGAQRSAGFGANHTINVNYGMAFGYSHQIIGGGTYGTAFGLANSVKGKCGLAAGNGCISNSENSFSFGEGLCTYGKNVAVFGQYNAYASNGAKTYLFAIGNGTSGTERKNALELDLESNLKIEGDLITEDGKLSEIIENASNKQDLELLEKYGTTDVYVLQEGVDFVLGDYDTIIEMLRVDYSGQTIAFPEGIKNISASVGEVPLTCKKLIFPDTLISFDVYPICIEEIITNKVQTLTLDPDMNYSNLEGKIPERIAFGENIRNICVRGGTKIVFDKPPINHVTIAAEIYGIAYSDWVSVNLRNVNSYTLELDDYNADEVTPPNFEICGYAGSKAERYARENNIQFMNIGSDCSPLLYSSKATETTLFANEYYTFTEIDSLTVTLDTASTTKLDEFMFSFETPNDVSSFSFGVLTDAGVEIKWVKEPNLKPNYIYEVSIVNNVGVIAGTAKEVTE